MIGSIHLGKWMNLIHPPYFKNPMDYLFKKNKSIGSYLNNKNTLI